MPNFARNSQQLRNQMRSANVKNLRTPDGKTMLQVIKQELIALKKLIEIEIKEYKAGYPPERYVRTGAWEDSIYIEDPKYEGNKIVGGIRFHNELALHPSVMSKRQPDGYVPWLMEVGWSISRRVQPRRDKFTDFKPGTQYLTKAVEKFNKRPSVKQYGIKVTIPNYWRGGTYYESGDDE